MSGRRASCVISSGRRPPKTYWSGGPSTACTSRRTSKPPLLPGSRRRFSASRAAESGAAPAEQSFERQDVSLDALGHDVGEITVDTDLACEELVYHSLIGVDVRRDDAQDIVDAP